MFGNQGPVPKLDKGQRNGRRRDRDREYAIAGSKAEHGYECHCESVRQAEQRVQAARQAEQDRRAAEQAARAKAAAEARQAAAEAVRRRAAEQAARREAARRAKLELVRQDRQQSGSRPLWLLCLLNPRPDRHPLPKHPEHLEVGDLLRSECILQELPGGSAEEIAEKLWLAAVGRGFTVPDKDPEHVRSEVEEMFAGLVVCMNAKGWDCEDRLDGDENQDWQVKAFEAGLNSRVGIGWHTLAPACAVGTLECGGEFGVFGGKAGDDYYAELEQAKRRL